VVDRAECEAVDFTDSFAVLTGAFVAAAADFFGTVFAGGAAFVFGFFFFGASPSPSESKSELDMTATGASASESFDAPELEKEPSPFFGGISWRK
jgi:hypothetical protein